MIDGGAGYHVIKTKVTTFDVFGGAGYNQEYFSAYSLVNPAPPPDTLDFAAVTQKNAELLAGEELNTILGKRTTVSENFTVYPNISGPSGYRFSLNSAISTKLNNWLAGRLLLQITTLAIRHLASKGTISSCPPVCALRLAKPRNKKRKLIRARNKTANRKNSKEKMEAFMMAELVQKISEKTSLPPEKAQEVANVVVDHLKQHLPAPLAEALNNYLVSGSVAGGAGWVAEAKTMAAEVGGMFGKKPE